MVRGKHRRVERRPGLSEPSQLHFKLSDRRFDDHLFRQWKRLELPFREPIGTGKLALRAASLALIAAPSRFLEGDFDQVTIDTREGVNGGRDEHSIIDLSLELPPEIDERFTRLVRLFRLEVVNSSINEISPRVPRNEALEDTNKGKKKEFESESELSGIRNVVTREIRLRWLLWTTCEKMDR